MAVELVSDSVTARVLPLRRGLGVIWGVRLLAVEHERLGVVVDAIAAAFSKEEEDGEG